MKIEKLEPSKHKAGRWLVWFEDGSLLRVGEGDVVSLGLYAGKELSPEQAEALGGAARQSALNGRAVELLSHRPMSRRELVDKLSAPVRRKKKGELVQAPPDPETLERERETLQAAAEAAADRMETLGLLDDRAYAQAVVRHYGGKGYGAKKLRDELYRRGVPRQFWDEALAEAAPEESGLDELLRRKLRGAEPSRENLKKASDYLARRGFGWEEISAALERYRRQAEEDG